MRRTRGRIVLEGQYEEKYSNLSACGHIVRLKSATAARRGMPSQAAQVRQLYLIAVCLLFDCLLRDRYCLSFSAPSISPNTRKTLKRSESPCRSPCQVSRESVCGIPMGLRLTCSRQCRLRQAHHHLLRSRATLSSWSVGHFSLILMHA